jgi:hypothetical protein
MSLACLLRMFGAINTRGTTTKPGEDTTEIRHSRHAHKFPEAVGKISRVQLGHPREVREPQRFMHPLLDELLQRQKLLRGPAVRASMASGRAKNLAQKKRKNLIRLQPVRPRQLMPDSSAVIGKCRYPSRAGSKQGSLLSGWIASSRCKYFNVSAEAGNSNSLSSKESRSMPTNRETKCKW